MLSCGMCLEQPTPSARPCKSFGSRHIAACDIESHIPVENAPPTHLFSMRSTLIQKSAHLIENTGKTLFCKPLFINQLHTLFHSSPVSPFAAICSPKHTGGVGGNRKVKVPPSLRNTKPRQMGLNPLEWLIVSRVRAALGACGKNISWPRLGGIAGRKASYESHY
jgi:hypothetical protein